MTINAQPHARHRKLRTAMAGVCRCGDKYPMNGDIRRNENEYLLLRMLFIHSLVGY